MPNEQVFLSYSLEDVETARHLVGAMAARGWAISWERYEDPDAIAALALREALNESDCVVVLWSVHSVDSDFVREEARSARSRGALVQATLDDAAVPMPFVLDEPTPLTDAWSVTTLVQQIARVLDDANRHPSREFAERAPGTDSRLEARVLETAERHAELGELDRAIEIYERWVAEKPHDMKATRRLGDLYLAADREPDAAERYERVAEHYAASGFLVPAIETFRRMVDLVPQNDAYSKRLAELIEEKRLQTTGTQQAMSAAQFTLTAPPYVAAGETFSLDVWAHREDDLDEIRKRLDARPALSAEAGPALTARVHVDGLDGDGTAQNVSFSGGIGRGRFFLSSSKESVHGGRAGVVGIYFLGLQIARIHFIVQIGDETAPTEVIPSRHERHTRAAACFAPEDRGAVVARIRSFEKAAPGVDITLETSDFSEFLDRISERDVLYLFWSEHAAASSDVAREWRYALRLRGVDFIDPVPLDGTHPPPELATLHDGDWSAVPEVRETPPAPAPELEG